MGNTKGMSNMSNSIKAVMAMMVMSVFMLVGCQPATAATLPVDFTLGYTDNGVIDKEGVTANVGTEVNNIKFGLTTFTSSDKLESYGAYAAVPIRVQGTSLTVLPTVKIEDYREYSKTVGSVGLGLDFAMTDTVSLSALGMTSRSLSGSSDKLRGEVYTLGLTKRF